MSADRQYYFITLPFNDRAIGQRTAQIQFLKNELGLQSDVTHYALEVPALKIGTLDVLMEASDELSRVDPLLEQITTKMLHLLEDVSGKPRADVARVRMDMTCDQYLLSFRWDDRRYDLRDALKTTIDRITHEIQATDDKVRLKYIDYNETRKKLNQVHRKEGGNLTIRPLNDVVRAFNRNNYGDENPLETEYLVTLYVVLPSSSLREWTDSYWHLGGIEFVVPQSSKVILQDGEFTLVNVVLFRKFMEDFKKECRSRKWTIREGIFSETKHEAEKIQSTSEEQRGHLLHMLATNFSESFQGYVHIKVIRMFVESILRYGLPPNFVCFCMMLTDKQERSVRQRLEHVCTTVLGLKSSADEGDVGALQLEFPYVSLRLANVYRSK